MQIQISNKTIPDIQEPQLFVMISVPGEKPKAKTKAIVYQKLTEEQKGVFDKIRNLINELTA